MCITQKWPENYWEFSLPLAENSADMASQSWLKGVVEDKNEDVFLFFAYILCAACLFKKAFAWEWCISIYQNLTSATQLCARCCWVLFQIWFHYDNALSTFYFLQGALSDHSNQMVSITITDLCPSFWPLHWSHVWELSYKIELLCRNKSWNARYSGPTSLRLMCKHSQQWEEAGVVQTPFWWQMVVAEVTSGF